MSYHLINLLEELGRPRVLVVGDLILDRYTWGDAERVSQEAPSCCCVKSAARHGWAGRPTWPTCYAAWRPM